MFELAIKGGYVADPSSGTGSRLNVGIQEGKISCVTSDEIDGSVEIDARGLIVSPGFIDMHIHEDAYDQESDSFHFVISGSMLKMGVTTVIGGNCGIGDARAVEYMDTVDRLGYPVNIGMLVPHEGLRRAVGDFTRYESVPLDHIHQMKLLLQQQLEGGCFGLSLGIEYNPGIGETEALELIRVAAKNNTLTAIHQRSDGAAAAASVGEIIRYAMGTGASVQISHLSSMCSFGNMEQILSLLDGSKQRGVDIGFDAYPYYAFCTYLGSAVFDEGFLNKYGYGTEAFSRLKIASGKMKNINFDSKSFYEIRQEEPDTLVIAHLLNENEVDRCIMHPACIIVSDGLYNNGQGHPRGSGTFPKFIHDYVVKNKNLSLNEAIAKITDSPAKRLGIKQKGRLSAGADADVTIFDLDRIQDEATYEEPFKKPSGIEYVIINGQLALTKGEIVRRNLGRSVRKIR